jgi:hypothetical protein
VWEWVAGGYNPRASLTIMSMSNNTLKKIAYRRYDLDIGERTKWTVPGRRTRVWAVTSVNAWRQTMRIRRNILAPAILTIGTIGALVSGPVLALTTTAAPAGAAVAVSVHPDMITYGA